jgi:hypothetical protein
MAHLPLMGWGLRLKTLFLIGDLLAHLARFALGLRADQAPANERVGLRVREQVKG